MLKSDQKCGQILREKQVDQHRILRIETLAAIRISPKVEVTHFGWVDNEIFGVIGPRAAILATS